MAMLIVAEKYRVAAKLAKVLGYQFSRPFFRNQHGDTIAFSSGHLYQIAYRPINAYNWENPTAFNYLPRNFITEPISDDQQTHIRGSEFTTGQLRLALLSAMRANPVIVNACDNDREGERIFYDLFNDADTEAEIYRLDLTRGVTRSLIVAAFDSLLDGITTKPYYYSAQARSVGDLSFALLTMVYTYYGRKGLLHPLLQGYADKHSSVVSVGRLIIPTLQLISQRCIDVESSMSARLYRPFLEASIDAGKTKCVFTYDYEYFNYPSSLLITKNPAQAYLRSKQAHDIFEIISVDHSYGVQLAPEPFSTPSIQAAMPDMTPKETMSVLQELYMKGLISYPRTDETSIPIDYRSPSRLEDLFSSLNANFATTQDRQTKGSVQFLNSANSKVSAIANGHRPSCIKSQIDSSHTGLQPTNAKVDLSTLSDRELTVYTKVCERFTAALSPPKSVCTVSIRGAFKDETLGLLGEERAVFLLTKTVAAKDSGSSNKYVNLSVGDEVLLSKLAIEHVQEDDLNYYLVNEIPQALATIGQSVSDPDVANILNQTKGLGTAATRDTIVDKLVLRGYVELVRKDGVMYVVITSKGEALLTLVPSDLKSPTTTAKWERHLYDIERATSIDQAIVLRNQFIAAIIAHNESLIQLMNRKFGAKDGAPFSVAPEAKLLAQVKRRALELGLSLSHSTLKCKADCLAFLHEHQPLLHSEERMHLEGSGLQVSSDVARDSRRIALRTEALRASNNDHPPTTKQLSRAQFWSAKVGLKIPTKAKVNARDCDKFTKLCISKRLPTSQQVSTLKSLAVKTKTFVPKTVYESRAETKQWLNKLLRLVKSKSTKRN